VIASVGPKLSAATHVPATTSSNGDAKAVARTNGAQNGRAAIAYRSTAARRAPHAAQRMLDVCRYLDVAVALGAIVSVFLLTNVDHPGAATFTRFLDMRVTVKNLLLLGIFAWVMHAILATFRLYDERRLEMSRAYALRLIAACAVGAIPLVAFPLTSSTGDVRPVTVAYFAVVCVLALGTFRWVIWVTAHPTSAALRNVLIVGSGPRAQRLFRELHLRADAVQICGFVDTNPMPPVDEIAQRMIGSLNDLEGILMRHVIDDVLITLPIKSCYGEIQDTIALCERLGVRAAYLADVFQSALGRPSFEQTGRFSIIRMHVVTDDHRMLIKRAIDIFVGALGLLVAAPFMILIALAIKATSPGPVIFSQERFGLNKRRFSMFKFRTMVSGAEALQADLEERNEAIGPVFKIRDDPRVTPIGRWLRRMSLDELPQLFNVVRGDMSLVGPRPLPVRDVHRFSESWLMRRFSVPPGVTGLWQISGRSDLTFDRWVALDLQYIDGWSLGLDFRILAKTVPAVLWGRGAA
jgi:exopolysaccharide biosynthesis polyprenyl glycosylphosphotransferase